MAQNQHEFTAGVDTYNGTCAYTSLASLVAMATAEEGIPLVATSLDEWLSQHNLGEYAELMHQELDGVENQMEVLKAEKEEDIRSMASAIKMRKGHVRVFVQAWKKLQ